MGWDGRMPSRYPHLSLRLASSLPLAPWCPLSFALFHRIFRPRHTSSYPALPISPLQSSLSRSQPSRSSEAPHPHTHPHAQDAATSSFSYALRPGPVSRSSLVCDAMLVRSNNPLDAAHWVDNTLCVTRNNSTGDDWLAGWLAWGGGGTCD